MESSGSCWTQGQERGRGPLEGDPDRGLATRHGRASGRRRPGRQAKARRHGSEPRRASRATSAASPLATSSGIFSLAAFASRTASACPARGPPPREVRRSFQQVTLAGSRALVTGTEKKGAAEEGRLHGAHRACPGRTGADGAGQGRLPGTARGIRRRPRMAGAGLTSPHGPAGAHRRRCRRSREAGGRSAASRSPAPATCCGCGWRARRGS